MPEKWTGDLIGRMHNNDISRAQLAKKLGINKSYLSMILASKRTPPNIEQRVTKAVDELIAENEVSA